MYLARKELRKYSSSLRVNKGVRFSWLAAAAWPRVVASEKLEVIVTITNSEPVLPIVREQR